MKKNNPAGLLLLTLLLLLLPCIIQAQKSYIYIELIKTIPCRVLQNGQEVAQLNRNYIILNIAEQSEQIIDIEFGADLYPKQNFIVDVMPDAAYAYKLAKSGEKSFYLLDLINNGKIIESNSKVNIGFATGLNKINFGKNQPPNTRRQTVSSGNRLTKIFTRNNTAKTTAKTAVQQPVMPKTAVREKYGVVEVIRPGSGNQTGTQQQPAQNPATTVSKATVGHKSSCVNTASDKEVELFSAMVAAKKNEEVQLLMIRKKKFTGCLTVRQVIHMGETYNSQYGRLQFIKIVQGNVANPLELPQCESLFKSESYKNKLLELINAR